MVKTSVNERPCVPPNEEVESLGPDTGDLSDLYHLNTSAANRHIQNDLTYRWPNKLISVDLSPQVAPNVVGSMHQAFKELGIKAGIKFKAHSYDDEDYIRIFNGGGCASMLGRQGGRQYLTLGSGCHSMATIMHEFTHALGIGHTQSRPDRDDYVTINWDNIDLGVRFNFLKFGGEAWTTNNQPYNYMSVMHYTRTAFTSNGKDTITTKDPFYQNLIGQHASYTAEDVQDVEYLYDYDPVNIEKGGCECESFILSGSELHPEQNGIYVKSEIEGTGRYNYRWNYKHESGDHWLHYQRHGLYPGQFRWAITYDLERGLKHDLDVDSFEVCPENIDETAAWRERNTRSEDWIFNDEINLKCLDSIKCANKVSAFGYIFHRGKPAINSFRPFYTNVDKSVKFFHNQNSWKLFKNGLLSLNLPSGNTFCLEESLLKNKIAFNTFEDINIKNVSFDESNTEESSDSEDVNEFYWTVNDWSELKETISTGEFIKSPTFKSSDGHSFELRVYPNGRSSSEQISMYAYTVATPNDEFLTWPLHGKQITLGIIEGGKSDKDRLVNKRSFYTSPSGTKWDNPSKYGSGNSGWSSFMSHALFYYTNWSFVFDDSVKFFFKVSEVTGTFLNCETFDECFYSQQEDDDLDFDNDGFLYSRGLAKLKSLPMRIWGQRCLHLTLEASSSFTMSVTQEIIETESQIPIFRERFYPAVEDERFEIEIDYGNDDYKTGVQYYLNLEVLNHEEGFVQLQKIFQSYGPCQ